MHFLSNSIVRCSCLCLALQVAACGGAIASADEAPVDRQLTGGGTAGVVEAAAGGALVSAGGSASSGGGSAAPRPGDCNDLVNIGPPVLASVHAEEPPEALGGTIVAGHYVATRYQEFTGEGGSETAVFALSLQGTLRITERSPGEVGIEMAEEFTLPARPTSTDRPAPTRMTMNAILRSIGSSYSTTVSCPGGFSGANGSYSASEAGLVLISAPRSGRTQVTSFLRQ